MDWCFDPDAGEFTFGPGLVPPGKENAAPDERGRSRGTEATDNL